MKRLLFPIIAILFLVGAGCGTQPTFVDNQNNPGNQNSEPLINTNTNTNVNSASNSNQVPPANVNTNTNTDKTPPETTLPDKFDIKVSFASQAPLGDWSMPYQEACEETSAFLVKDAPDYLNLSEVSRNKTTSYFLYNLQSISACVGKENTGLNT